MLNCLLEPLPVSRQESLRQWLANHEAATLYECVASEVAALECQAAKATMKRPDDLLSTGQVGTDAMLALRQAARKKIFLDVLAELQRPDALFRKARFSTIQTQDLTAH